MRTKENPESGAAGFGVFRVADSVTRSRRQVGTSVGVAVGVGLAGVGVAVAVGVGLAGVGVAVAVGVGLITGVGVAVAVGVGVAVGTGNGGTPEERATPTGWCSLVLLPFRIVSGLTLSRPLKAGSSNSRTWFRSLFATYRFPSASIAIPIGAFRRVCLPADAGHDRAQIICRQIELEDRVQVHVRNPQ